MGGKGRGKRLRKDLLSRGGTGTVESETFSAIINMKEHGEPLRGGQRGAWSDSNGKLRRIACTSETDASGGRYTCESEFQKTAKANAKVCA